MIEHLSAAFGYLIAALVLLTVISLIKDLAGALWRRLTDEREHNDNGPT